VDVSQLLITRAETGSYFVIKTGLFKCVKAIMISSHYNRLNSRFNSFTSVLNWEPKGII
jgi:hypothetical protein